ncbi:MAG: GNAT family N-acetyltransferase [Actinomycetota bacterium]|nr:GNAT family N-acetyltransferase [Actinomycetota bacterium]
MALDPEKRERVIEAAAAVYSERGIVNAGRRDIAREADLPLRTVTQVGRHRVDFLRLAVERLPFPPIAEHVRAQAIDPAQPALQALLQAAREVLGDPAAAWDPLELQGIVAARYDPAMREVVSVRLNERWDAALAVVDQLRGSQPAEPFDNDAAALHLIAVGLGLSLLSPLAPRWSDARSWTALSARLLEALAAEDAGDHDRATTAWRARLTIADVPSAMARLLRVLSVLRVRVVSIFTAPALEGAQLVDLFLSAPPDVDRDTITHGLSSVGTDVIVAGGGPDDATDVATRVLQLSAALVSDPDAAPEAAANLVLANSWEVIDASEGPDASAFVLRLQWTLERHVVLRRFGAPFTRTEQNRASALLELVSALSEARGDEGGFGWREALPGGEVVAVRLARPQDAEAVEAMHERASPESRYQRYFTPMNQWREDNLRRISGGHRGGTLVVTGSSGEVIALGNVFPIGPHDADTGEIALIVDDAWHGRGVGQLLTAHLIGVAGRLGFSRLVAYVLAENRAMLHVLERTGLEWKVTPDHDLGASVTCLAADL